MLNRREFLGLIGTAASLPAASLRGSATDEWGSPVFDLHFHMRNEPAANIAHLDGAGIAKANLLTRATASDQVRAVHAAPPGRFTWFCSADPSKPEGVDALTQSVKAGARGFGEMKYHLTIQ
jgi:predicted TIM-barrel fold metal-dependent hydrolase